MTYKPYECTPDVLDELCKVAGAAEPADNSVTGFESRVALNDLLMSLEGAYHSLARSEAQPAVRLKKLVDALIVSTILDKRTQELLKTAPLNGYDLLESTIAELIQDKGYEVYDNRALPAIEWLKETTVFTSPSLEPRGGVNSSDPDYFLQLAETRGD